MGIVEVGSHFWKEGGGGISEENGLLLVSDLVEARPSRTKMMTPMQEFSTWLAKNNGEYSEEQGT